MADQDYPDLYAELEASAARARDAAISFETMLGGTKDQLVPVNGFPAQKTVEGRLAGLVDVRSLEGVFVTVAAGLAATKGTGDSNRFFRVPSADEAYETRYRNDAGVAVVIGQLLRSSERLDSIIPNGGFRNMGSGNTYYGDSAPTSAFQAPVKPITDTLVNGLGCAAGFELAASDTLSAGGLIEVDVSAVGHDETLQAFASVLVFSPDGTFDFGTNMGPVLFKIMSNNASNSTRLTEFTQLSATLRRYTISWEGTVPADPLYIKSYRLGLQTSLPRTKTFYATGLWLSLSPKSLRPSGLISLQDTRWPDWATGPASSVGASKMFDDVLALKTQAGSALAPAPGALTLLAQALRDPMHSVWLNCPGDSTTWGTGATGTSTSEPRNHALADARDNLTSNSWVNLLRKNFGAVYSEGAVIPDAPGSGYYSKRHALDPTHGDPRFRFVNAQTKRVVPTSSLSFGTSSGAMFGKYLDCQATTWPEFDIVGDNITIVHAGFISTDPAQAEVAVVDANTETELGRFSWHTTAVTWSKESTVTFPHGKYRIQLRDTSIDKRFRYEGVKVDHKIRVANNGIIGTWTGEWLPTGSLLPGAIQAQDEFIHVMLSTNDRGTATGPQNWSRTKENLRAIVLHLRDVLGKKVILVAANAAANDQDYPANATYKYSQQDCSRVIRELATELAVDFVDHYRPTKQALVDGLSVLTDGLHPNDAGYRMMFENIEKRIATSKP